jgi:hypothetical protein
LQVLRGRIGDEVVAKFRNFMPTRARKYKILFQYRLIFYELLDLKHMFCQSRKILLKIEWINLNVMSILSIKKLYSPQSVIPSKKNGSVIEKCRSRREDARSYRELDWISTKGLSRQKRDTSGNEVHPFSTRRPRSCKTFR